MNIPFSGQNKLWIFLDWLHDLGGQFHPLWEEPSTKRTGRRDPDKRARQYELGYHKEYWEQRRLADERAANWGRVETV